MGDDAKPYTVAEVEGWGRAYGDHWGRLLATTRALEAAAPPPGTRCPRCHRDAPNPDGCAACNPVRLGERLTEALAEIERRQMHAPPPTIVLTTDDSVTVLGEMLKAAVARAEKAERERDEYLNGEEDEIRRELAAVDPQPLLDAIAALEIALEPAPAPLDDPADVHAARPVVLEVLPQERPPSLAEIEALERERDAAPAAPPERMAPCPVCGDRHEAVVQRNGVTIIGCPRLSGDESYLFSSDYAVPLGEVVDEPADVHAARPPCDPHETLMDCPACRLGDRCDGFGPAKDPGEYAVPLGEVDDERDAAPAAPPRRSLEELCAALDASGARLRFSEYSVPLDEVEDEIEEASRATGIPVPRAVRS
jgi:hypothetical protein